jgi:hypothetical protein
MARGSIPPGGAFIKNMPKKLTECKYCQKSFDGLPTSERANHSRWCVKNPKRYLYTNNSKPVKQFQTETAKLKRIQGIKKAHSDGKYTNSHQKGIETKRKNGKLKHTDTTKTLLREKALKSTHRRLLKSTRKYTKIDGSVVTLDSSWEEALAIRLDELAINWERPKTPIAYTAEDGKIHNYFPDFYLSDYNLYLDPKNPFAFYVQRHKLTILKILLPNLILINSLEDCKNFQINCGS